jgi:tripartite-type tricarboxylate transporter receptor subunit TctC
MAVAPFVPVWGSTRVMSFVLRKLSTCVCVLVALAYTWSATPVRSSTPSSDEVDVAAYYKGKTVRIVVGFPPGGGYDSYSRVIGRHLGKHMPGNPTVIIDNMAGAGSIVAANYVFNVGPKDGTIIGNVAGPIILEQLFGNPGVRFDMAKFRYLAVPVPEVYLMLINRRSGITKLEELLGAKPRQATFGGIPNNTIEHAPLLMRDVVGANIKVVSGYKGTADIRLAMDSGEVDGYFNTWTSAKIAVLELIKNGEWVILAQLADTPLHDLLLSKVPTIGAIAKNEEQRELLRLGVAIPSQFAKMYLMSPGVPLNRAVALESAFMKTLQDRDFLKDAEKGKIEIDPLSGAKTSALVTQSLAMSAGLKARLKSVIHGQKR